MRLELLPEGWGALPGLAPGTDAEVTAATPGSGLRLELTREAGSQRVRSPSSGPDNKKGTQGPEAREQNEEQSARRALSNQRCMGPTFIGQWLPWWGVNLPGYRAGLRPEWDILREACSLGDQVCFYSSFCL